MKKVIVFNMVSVDGFFAGVDGDISWHNVDGEFNEFAIKQLEEEAETLLFGHTTYDLMASYWPSQQAMQNDPIVARLMNNTDKIVFNKNLEKGELKKNQPMKAVDPDEIQKLKQAEG